MADGRKYGCSHCDCSPEAWDESNPYFLSDESKPRFFYHPQESRLDEYVAQSEGRFLTSKEREDFLAKRIGNLSDMLCLDCGNTFQRDMEKQKAVCLRQRYKSKNGVDTWELEGKTCPSCKPGTFEAELRGISLLGMEGLFLRLEFVKLHG